MPRSTSTPLLGLALALLNATPALSHPPQTLCNPLDLDYGWSAEGYRHAADPVIVLFKNRYYLFTTHDLHGCRVSDDLIHWQPLPFPRELARVMTNGAEGYCAPAVAVHGDWLYFINMNRRRDDTVNHVLRTRDPAHGPWEKFAETRKVADPALFFDDDGKLYYYFGLNTPTACVELDPATFREIPGSYRELRPRITSVEQYFGGYERGRREIFSETDTRDFLTRFQILACQEGAWMTKHRGTYYLQYATPGTVSQWYCDTVMEGESPWGPFRHVDYAPAALKVGGFINSAGHGCVFQDRHGNWWRVATLWVGVRHLFERRVGIFPLEFDERGRMRTRTDFGDYPIPVPQGPRPAAPERPTGPWVLSFGKMCTASSSRAGHAPSLAVDEDVRTWWSAESGRPGEWFQVDLGRPMRVESVQLNFAEPDAHPRGERPVQRYRLLGSTDGGTWETLADQRQANDARPHAFVPLAEPRVLRYVKVENEATPFGVDFALRDLRVFGQGGGVPPSPALGLRARRDPRDDRNVAFTWQPATGADGYLIRFGPAPDALYQTVQVRLGASDTLTIHALNRQVRYWYRIDAYNENGVAPGALIADGKVEGK